MIDMRESVKEAMALGFSIGLVLGIFTFCLISWSSTPKRETINLIVFDMLEHKANSSFEGIKNVAVYSNGTGKYYFYGDFDKEALLSYGQGDHLVLEVSRRRRRYGYTLYDFYLMSECCDKNGYIIKYPRESSPIWRDQGS